MASYCSSYLTWLTTGVLCCRNVMIYEICDGRLRPSNVARLTSSMDIKQLRT